MPAGISRPSNCRGRVRRSCERRTQLEIERTAAQPLHAHAFIENQILGHAHPALRHCAQAAIAAYRGAGPGQGPLPNFLAALDPQRLASLVMVRRGDIDQVVANIESFLNSAALLEQDADAFVRVSNERDLRRNGMRGTPGKGKGKGPGRQRVLLASIEAVKGLEFEHVIMPSLAALDSESVNSRNLFYVGITRAKNRLTLLHEEGRPNRRVQALLRARDAVE
jgi:DNA helicase-2/ATP-dependent DNA helicase PcrA